jgi:hypothetical protein
MKMIVRCSLLIVILFATSAALIAQTITSIDPNNGQQGQSLGVGISGQDTHFDQAATMSIWFSQGGSTIYAYGYYPVNDTFMTAWFDIPDDAAAGLYDLNIYNDIDGAFTLYDSFRITLGNIVSVNPNSCQQGQILSVAITGQDTHFQQGTDFQQGSQTTVWFSQGSPTVYAENAWAVDDTLLIANFVFPRDATTGLRDLNVYNDIDGTLTLYGGFTITPYNPVLASITPNGAYQSQSLSVTITGQNTHFLQGTDFQQGSPTMYWSAQGTPTVSFVWLSQGSSTIYSRDAGAPGDTLLMARFDIPEDANAGLWDVHVPTKGDGMLTLQDGFTIAQPGDWTGDGKVNFLDFAVVADNWLEGTNE